MKTWEISELVSFPKAFSFVAYKEYGELQEEIMACYQQACALMRKPDIFNIKLGEHSNKIAPLLMQIDILLRDHPHITILEVTVLSPGDRIEQISLDDFLDLNRNNVYYHNYGQREKGKNKQYVYLYFSNDFYTCVNEKFESDSFPHTEFAAKIKMVTLLIKKHNYVINRKITKNEFYNDIVRHAYPAMKKDDEDFSHEFTHIWKFFIPDT